MRRRRRFLCAAAAVLALPLLLCAPARAKGKEKTDVVVVMPPAAEPEAGFDPAYGWGVGEHLHEPLIQSTLLRTNKELAIENDLAAAYSCSEDGLVWTVRIRDDVVFSDGVALTAEDVAFSYNNCRDHNVSGDFAMLREAAAVDEETVEFYMNQPFALWPYTMTEVGIVPKHAYDETYGEHPIGSGRYVLRQWDRGARVVFEANPDYYETEPQIKTITVLFLEEEASAEAARAGKADVAYTTAASVRDIPGYSLQDMDTIDNFGISIPCGGSGARGFAADVNARRAMNLAIDREKIVADVLRGYGEAAYSVCDKLPWYNEAAATDCSPQAAQVILENNGWLPGEDGILEKDGQRAQFLLQYEKDDALGKRLAGEIAAQLREIGIEVQPAGVERAEVLRRAQTEAMLWAWGLQTPMELYNLYHTQPESGLAQYAPYANPVVDDYMDEALRAVITQDSYELWQMAQWDGATGVTQAGDLPWIWLCNVDHLYFVRDGLKLEDQKVHPHGHGWPLLDNVEEWSWD